MIRVLLADDHRDIRKAVRAFLEHESDIVVVGEAEDGLGALRLAASTGVDVLITEFTMPSSSIGVDTIGAVKAINPGIAVVILSRHPDEEFQVRALAAGADAYVVKDLAEPELIPTVRAVTTLRTLCRRIP